MKNYRRYIVLCAAGRVVGLVGSALAMPHTRKDYRGLSQQIADRAANGEGFPSERIVRLPRRLSRRPWREAFPTMIFDPVYDGRTGCLSVGG